MEKYNSIEEFLKSENVTKVDVKDYILQSSLYLGYECAKLPDGEGEGAGNVFLVLGILNKIIDNVK